ncbi:prepilin-type N-terminal cleavage/methylation domain-containing protein [Desulfospira joergensenii]|uniref:prepilin-type N-terminal cleavage/methylation domain-containing protein n=1 Tax=Desulfospira joergensenii TaxID=53329 RepID=UPI0003B3A5FF|nr:prepilin-type N-terminal cleavage/methylation domain-containing protein [Desulfospira joergensenii]
MRKDKGFTLIELMITMVIAGLIMIGAYAAYTSQQKTYYAQDQVTEMQQNIRAALSIITSELRMAGYDPTGSGNFGIVWALPGRFQMTTDMDGDGVVDGPETLEFGFSFAMDADSNGDGIPDNDNDGDGVPDPIDIGMQTNNAGGYQDIAESIQAVEFLYYNASGNITATVADIRSVQMTVLARARRQDPQFTHTTTYTTPSGQNWGPYNDNFRRRMLTTRIRCRNLGLN